MKYLNTKFIKRILLITFASVGIILFFVFDGSKYFNISKLLVIYKEIIYYVDVHYYLSLLIFICIYILCVFLSIPIKPFLKMLAGLVFGLFLGFIASLISATIGAMLIFLLIKYSWGETPKSYKNRLLDQFSLLVDKYPIRILIFSRLMPIPFFIPNIAAAILKVKNSIFFFCTLIGIIPMTFIYVWLGTHVNNTVFSDSSNFIDSKLIVAIVVILMMALTPVLLKFRCFYMKLWNFFKR